ncbi:heterocyst differentiation protein HetF [[Leptolyngbya] sp. PCC 7376]|uniref:CHAT domain-containing tetratricopeptide repeat protein n=1 Tax=[Leptolyngbya] sp. PCC 7376 TaxID=111781 RepID=UPI00029F3AC7|nr:CHAT domain-containing protein [[Leptolyngbya] sp. PCC 7376]AFY38226.1 heterocyst differentiation protein HetF [[Leptolyngbya] sp. PCC 7376]
MFQDFQLSITHLGDNRYFLRTEKVAAGVPLAEEQVEWDVDYWLATAQNLMSDPLSRLLQGTGRLSAQNRLVTPDTDLAALSMTEVPTVATTLMEFGQQLHQALFVGSLRDSWSKAQAIAHNQNQILRLRLGFKEARLLSLPWEVINRIDVEDGEVESLTTGIETSFSRYHSKTQASSDAPSMDDVAEQTLKILMVLASPADQDRLELRQEASHLQSELDKETLSGMPPLELTILDNPGRQELTEMLEQGQYQVFHYAGHSNLGNSGGDIYLVNRETGLTEEFAGDDLAGLLVNNGVQFALFNSCHGADGIANYQAEGTSEQNLAQALVRRGIPAVLAMSAQIPDQVALTFTRLLYRNLHLGYPIDFSLGRVRQGLISAYGSHQLYWALPVLYMNPHFHGLLQHRPLNREGLAELLHISEAELAALSPEDEARLAIADLTTTGDDFLADESDESLFSPPSNLSSEAGEETAFIKNILAEISSDIQDIKEDKQTNKTDSEPKGLVLTSRAQANQFVRRYPWQIALGLVAVIAIGGGLLWQANRQRSIRIPVVETSIPQSENVELNSFSNETLLELARERKGDWSLLYRITTHLLDQEALPLARAILYDIANPDSADSAQLNFLKGRYAWHLILKDPVNNIDESSLDDVRRFWSTAYDADPQQPYYLYAAGFADYASGRYDAAVQTWTEVINLAMDDPPLLAQAYAGLALAFYQQAETQSGEPQQDSQSKAMKLRTSAYRTDPDGITVEALSQNWLWSETAIATWRELSDLK